MRAYVTKRLGHGERYLVTRAYLSDGTIEQRVNPGLADDDDVPWERFGRYEDVLAERDRLRREGWTVDLQERHPPAPPSRHI
jgi:hypothetical protein